MKLALLAEEDAVVADSKGEEDMEEEAEVEAEVITTKEEEEVITEEMIIIKGAEVMHGQLHAPMVHNSKFILPILSLNRYGIRFPKKQGGD
jgi:hypothetical protein